MRGPRGLLVAVLLSLLFVPAAAGADEGDVPLLIVFWGDGCPHCAAEWEFLEELGHEYPDLEVRGYEVWHNPSNQVLFEATMEQLGLEARAVPTTIFDGRVWEGYSSSVGTQIRNAVAAALAPVPAPPANDPDASEVIDLPLVGEIDTGAMPLFTSTVLIALVDGINPCSLWALSVLLALVLRTGSRRRVMAIGATFLAVTALLYGFYIAGMYGFLSYASNQTWVRLVMAAIALGFGVVNLKDYFRYGQGLSLSIPARSRPGLYRRMRSIATDESALPVALAGTALLAVGVSVLETPCTAGYPVLWANLLSSQDVGLAAALPLYGVYMLVFLIDELVVFGTAVVAMRVTKLEERAGRLLKLIGGVVMITLAFTLLLVPEAMSSVGGALAVFGVAALVIVGLLAIEWARRSRRGSEAARWSGRGTGRRAGPTSGQSPKHDQKEPARPLPKGR